MKIQTLPVFTDRPWAKVTAYLNENRSTKPRRAMIVCPGGGYAHLAFREDEPIAMMWASEGFQTFVLHYGINENASAPIAGVCFLKKAPHNSIRRLSSLEAAQKILSQTIRKFETADKLDRLLTLLNHFVMEIPVYELENLPEPAAARLSYETMRQTAQETKV